MISLAQLPFSPAQLEQYRIATRRQQQATLVGGHQMRRKGQSLEFRDYRAYMPGDDVRHIDWRASARHGGKRDLLVKTFEAEENMTIVISIDTRESMDLPHQFPKLQVAAWLAEAISRVALHSGDRVVLHRLFGRDDKGLEILRGVTHFPRIRQTLQRFCAYSGSLSHLNLDLLNRYLPPASVWLIITDFYFDVQQEARKLAFRMVKAQDGLRWLMTMDLDSWPYEKFHLGLGGRKIEGPGLPSHEPLLDIQQETLGEVEKRIKSHKDSFRRLVTRDAYDAIHWQWPASEPDPAHFFRHHFSRDHVLQRLFMKGKG